MSHTLRHDKLYYCEDVIIQVEDVLFKLPKGLFAPSEVFRGLFATPPPPGQAVDGASDEQPLRLDGVALDDFRQFLAVLFPIESLEPASEPGSDFGTILLDWGKDWLPVLRLSTMWGFEDLRAQAVDDDSGANRIDPAEKVAIAKQYSVDEWMWPALQTLARRNEPLTVEESQRLIDVGGLEFLVKISALREACTAGYVRSSYRFDEDITRLFDLTKPSW